MHAYLWLCLFLVPSHVVSQCNSTGDLWSIHCILLAPYYSGYQWATCVSSQYIYASSQYTSAFSGLRHVCRNGATQCYNQCMLESFDASQGDVNVECACTPNGTTPLQPLPPRCYQPDGSYCGWYADCLEVRYPCLGTSDIEAVEYNEKLCGAYVSHYDALSQAGRDWIDGARNCSLFALVPLIRPWVNKTCPDASVATVAFNSHVTCYLRGSGAGASSLCDLAYQERFKVFWILFGSVFKDGTFQSNANEMLGILKLCSSPIDFVLFKSTVTPVLIIFSGTSVQPALREGAARELVNSVAGVQKWSDSGIGWFSLLGGVASKSGTMNVTVLLADLKALGVSNSSSEAKTGQVNMTLGQLGSAFSRGLLSSLSASLSGDEVTSAVLFVGECGDIACSPGLVTALTSASGTEEHVHVRTHAYLLIAMMSLVV